MKINKEGRRLAKELLRSSFSDGQLDRARVSQLVSLLIEKKPRNYVQVLDAYKRLIRLEVEKRTATIETATELSPEVAARTVENLKRRYGSDLDTSFIVNPELLGGMRVRVGNDVWDSSVRNRLQRLQQQL
ncbi:MAG: F0F1 ATP synthase subunit delta [Chthoniobacterales bacterium]|nr:F0F1 ATP synthase subunit delta [Chthoniobacterales bacterium]